MAAGASCISSRIMRVLSGMIFVFDKTERFVTIFCGSKLPSNSSSIFLFLSHVMYAQESYSLLPNSLSSHVLPTCLAPSSSNGFRKGLFFHSFNLPYNNLLMIVFYTFLGELTKFLTLF